MHFDKPSSVKEIKEGLEGSDPATKVQAMQKAIMMLLNGEQLPGMFITILQYVLPSEDHTIQKLLLLYLVRGLPFIDPAELLRAAGRAYNTCPHQRSCDSAACAQETIEKTDAKGKLLPEMVRNSSSLTRSLPACQPACTHSLL